MGTFARITGLVGALVPQRAQNLVGALVPQSAHSFVRNVRARAMVAASEDVGGEWSRSVGDRAGRLAGGALGLSVGAISGLLTGGYRGYSNGEKAGGELGARFSATLLTAVGMGLGYLVHATSQSDYPVPLMIMSTVALNYFFGSLATQLFKSLGGALGAVYATGAQALQNSYAQGKNFYCMGADKGAFLGRLTTMLGAESGSILGQGLARKIYAFDSGRDLAGAIGKQVGKVLVPLVSAAVFEYFFVASFGLTGLLAASLAAEGIQRSLKPLCAHLPGQMNQTAQKAVSLMSYFVGLGLFAFNYLEGGIPGTAIRFGAGLLQASYSTLVWNEGAIPLSMLRMAFSTAATGLSIVFANATMAVLALGVAYAAGVQLFARS